MPMKGQDWQGEFKKLMHQSSSNKKLISNSEHPQVERKKEKIYHVNKAKQIRNGYIISYSEQRTLQDIKRDLI